MTARIRAADAVAPAVRMTKIMPRARVRIVYTVGSRQKDVEDLRQAVTYEVSVQAQPERQAAPPLLAYRQTSSPSCHHAHGDP
jgi:hypothetical protein